MQFSNHQPTPRPTFSQSNGGVKTIGPYLLRHRTCRRRRTASERSWWRGRGRRRGGRRRCRSPSCRGAPTHFGKLFT